MLLDAAHAGRRLPLHPDGAVYHVYSTVWRSSEHLRLVIGLWRAWQLNMPAPVAGPVGVSVYDSLTAYEGSIIDHIRMHALQPGFPPSHPPPAATCLLAAGQRRQPVAGE